MSPMNIHGAFAPVPTPLTRDDRLDPETLGRHLRWLAAEGLDGALILGSNGEFPSLSLAERTTVARTAAASGADLRLILNVGSCCLAEVEQMLRTAAECDYYAVLCPPAFLLQGCARCRPRRLPETRPRHLVPASPALPHPANHRDLNQ